MKKIILLLFIPIFLSGCYVNPKVKQNEKNWDKQAKVKKPLDVGELILMPFEATWDGLYSVWRFCNPAYKPHWSLSKKAIYMIGPGHCPVCWSVGGIFSCGQKLSEEVQGKPSPKVESKSGNTTQNISSPQVIWLF